MPILLIISVLKAWQNLADAAYLTNQENTHGKN